MQDERMQPLLDTMSWGGGRVETLVGRIRQGAKRISISGLHGGALPYTLSRLAEVVSDHPMLVVTADPKRANKIYDDLSFFLAEQGQHSHSRVRYYASDEILPYSEMMPDRGAIQSRLRTLLQLQNDPPPIAVMPAAALIRKVMPREQLSRRSDILMVAEEVDQDELLKRLIESGYRRVSVVEDRGTFAVRGALIDIFAPLYNHPVRIELDDDIVCCIRFFEPENQRTHHEVEELLLGPVDEAICTVETLRQARIRFADLADSLEYSTQELKQLLEDLGQGLRPFGIQRWVPGFYEHLDSIFDYLPKDTVIVMDEPHEIAVEIHRYSNRMQEEFDFLLSEGGFAFPPKEFLLTSEQLESKLSKFSRLEHQAVLTLEEADSSKEVSSSGNESSSKVAQFTMGANGVPTLPFSTLTHTTLRQQLQSRSPTEERRLQPLVDQIQYWLDEKLRVAIVCGSRGQALRLQELLKLYDVPTYAWNDKGDVDTMEKMLGRQAPVDLLLGRISEGFVFPQARLAVLSEEEIFGPKARRRRSKKKALAQTELESLRKGDFIIHKLYGMASYGGLFTLTLGEETGDFVLLEFHGTDRLYLPITRLNAIDRYTGGGKPNLDKLRGSSFEKKKSKARAAIQAMAGSLIQLYAERQAQKGNSFPQPDDAYHDFAARFPFEETPDQFQAIEDVLADLQSERCMDRLICGDVGYGKTEVAMRGAFHAAYNGRQVAVLVPTTVLAQQHGLNFIERFDGYPLKIGILSRFQSAKEKKELVKGLAEGTVDIVVGTHRLLSKDIHFKDLGLLIVDEEHRFGVRHKERIKQFRKQVDVLTLTATPIPRTLEMSIAGIRDLTLIRTAPHDRLAIRTSIAPFDMQVIREAVMRELNRGGQVFFVHNRVESIGKIQAYLTNLIPESRIVVAHGQMPEAELERAMLDFVQGKFNILLCTSIIESGLDIPRANTIIVDRADAFGLAQLYQIRGRVGRGRERAYAVLLVPNNKRITPEAKERLQILQRFSDLGAGFEIARHDLEMRGAGNLLGKEQSGHIHAVGMDLYLSMLEEAMAEIQDKPVRERIEPEVKLGVDAYLPDYYVPDIQLRLQCYRRLTSAETPEELEDMYKEFCDRFGAPEPAVDNLFKVVEIQQTMSKMMATTGAISRNRFRLFFSPNAPIELDRILTLVQAKDAPFAMVPPNGLEMTEDLAPGQDKLDDILLFLRQLEASIFETGGA